MAREGADLEAAIYSHLIDAVGQEEKASLIREAGLRMAELGHREQAEQFYASYLEAVQGYDPQIRDKYGQILEDGQRWEEIKELEGNFLSQ